MSASPYLPIPCADHERLEFAVLTKQWLELTVDGVVQLLLPLDVYTREGAEWLQAKDATGETRVIRLDRLTF